MTTEAERTAVAEALERLSDAIWSGDAAVIEALHESDAMIFDLAPPLGRRFEAAPLIDWLSTWGGPVRESWGERWIEVSGDLAVCHGYSRTDTSSKAGEGASWWVRRSVSLRHRDGRWRVVHDHASVPFSMDESQRAATDLEPPTQTQAGQATAGGS